jgi:NADH dehydrogenase [ubiquinone] 1 alpha subcomplex assembly factor 7
MTPLARLLAERIRETGPITVADYMAECLLHPVHGYYTTRDPFGAAGDFTTAPEISQMFGELIGLALAQAWIDRGSPAPFTLAELGPGRGTLMADILRATKGVPGFHAAAKVVLVEASPVLRDRQAATLSSYAPVWVDRIEDGPEGPLFLVANEFLDALPVRQFQHGPRGWHERLIGLRDDKLSFGLSAPLPQVPDTPAFQNAPDGTLVEDNVPARAAVAAVASRLARHGGVAYWIDYGGWRSQGDTLQALRRHQPDDPLAHPGEADLTAHVDFEPLAALAQAFAYDTQGAVLTRLGIDARAERLARNLTGAALESHRAAHRRLTHAEEMGSLFKVLAITSAGAPPPPGFA